MRPDPDALGDLHSHLVPGVDDGARTLKDGLDTVEAMTRAGVRRIVTTPHLKASLMGDELRAEAYIRKVQRAFLSLVDAVREAFPEVVLWRGFEIMLDVPDPDFSDPRLRMAGTRFVLVEWPRLSVPPQHEAVLYRIRAGGWIPVLAHPERYRGVDEAMEMPRRWRAAGAYLQVNHGSLLGRYGNEIRNRALRLLQAGEADYLSSDHHPRPGDVLSVGPVRELMRQMEAEESFLTLTRTNPQRLMEDREPLAVDGFEFKPGLFSRLSGLLGRR
jgi:protein-tyrosine phosphatase